VFLAFLLLRITVLSAAAQDFPLTFGKHETLDSKILAEKRDILVSVPAHPVQRMPLLILLDGEWNLRNVSTAVGHLTANDRLPPMVVAGVVNTDRGRDLMPTFEGDKFAAGPSDRFLSFLADELIPKLAAEYPIGKFRILAGHSNAGMFSLYAFIRRPELFQANIALSPSFGLDDRFVAQLAGALAKPVPAPRFVFIGAGGDEEADISVGAMRFAKTFEGASSADIEFHYEVFRGRPTARWGIELSIARSRVLDRPTLRPAKDRRATSAKSSGAVMPGSDALVRHSATILFHYSHAHGPCWTNWQQTRQILRLFGIASAPSMPTISASTRLSART
jgi:predicted alpha/beta superfamily hydrolase